MSESSKTLAYLAVAAVTLAVAFLTKPTVVETDTDDWVGKMLTDAFEPEEAKRLTIVRFDEETATLSEFEVAEQDGFWTIPSKGGYPADAFEQMAEATVGVSDREILSIASQNPADHEQYGVVDPRSPKLEVGQTGVGVRVTLADAEDQPLADLIIGKEVKGQPDQRYARKQGQDIVYVVKIDPEKFSTSFEEWIEDDLLKIDPFEIHSVTIDDYSADMMFKLTGPEISWLRRGKFKLRYDDDQSKWVADSLESFDPEKREFVDAPLAAGEELNEDTLRELKNALDDLRIVDVNSKPARLSANLKASQEVLDDEQALMSLVRRGFAPLQNAAGELDIISSEGEVVCTMNDGVEYLLRFGGVDVGKESSDPGASGAEGDAADDAGVNRFLFVFARLNADVVEEPEYEPLPEGGNEPEADAETDSAEEAKEGETEADSEEDGEEDGEASEPSERDLAERRNRELKEAYEGKLAAAKKRVDELNERFGGWYYVVSDSVFNKIRLKREDLVTKAEGAESEDGEENNAADDTDDTPAGLAPSVPSLGFGTEPPAGDTDADGAAADGAETDGAETNGAETDSTETDAAETTESATDAVGEAAAQSAGE